MLKRRKAQRQARELARLLLALDPAAVSPRPWQPRPLIRRPAPVR